MVISTFQISIFPNRKVPRGKALLGSLWRKKPRRTPCARERNVKPFFFFQHRANETQRHTTPHNATQSRRNTDSAQSQRRRSAVGTQTQRRRNATHPTAQRPRAALPAALREPLDAAQRRRNVDGGCAAQVPLLNKSPNKSPPNATPKGGWIVYRAHTKGGCRSVRRGRCTQYINTSTQNATKLNAYETKLKTTEPIATSDSEGAGGGLSGRRGEVYNRTLNSGFDNIPPWRRRNETQSNRKPPNAAEPNLNADSEGAFSQTTREKSTGAGALPYC